LLSEKKNNQIVILAIPLMLTVITYVTRYLTKTDLHTCWFEPSTYDWLLHGPNV